MKPCLSRWLAGIAMVATGAVATAGTCEAPRVPTARLNAIVRAMGAESFQMDPSIVIARLTFSAPDAPPSVETVYSGGDSRYVERIIAEALLLRTPCATAAAPVHSTELQRVGVFMRNGRREPEPRLRKDLLLGELVRLVSDLKSQHVKFDTREMSCPFSVRFSPFRPYMENAVEEVGPSEPGRAPLLDWLRTLTLAIPKDMMVTAIGRESLIAIPCAVLDLS
jgi:hypothetical protein